MKYNKLPTDFIDEIYKYVLLKKDYFYPEDILNDIKVNNLPYYEKLFNNDTKSFYRVSKTRKKIISGITYRLDILRQKGFVKRFGGAYENKSVNSQTATNKNLINSKRKFPEDLLERIYNIALNYNSGFYLSDILCEIMANDRQYYNDLFKIGNSKQINSAINYRLDSLCKRNILKKLCAMYVICEKE